MKCLLKKHILTSATAVLFLGLISCNSNGSYTQTETTVLDVDTVDAEVTYDLKRKTVESVDTVGATTEYTIEKKIVERTVEVDTLTKEITREKEKQLEQGDYEVVDKNVEEKEKTEEIDIGSE